MGTIVVYKRIPPEQIRAEAEDGKRRIREWFAAHPRKRVCRVGFWYERLEAVRKGHVDEDVDAAAERALKGTDRVDPRKA